MTIHHATVKRAASMGIILTDDDGVVTALHAERAIELTGDDPKALIIFVAVAAKLKVEYPAIVINDEGEASTDEVDTFYTIDPEDSIENNVAALLEAAADIDTGEPEEDESPIVVAERYKAEYKARGDASGCGDWLHVTLKRFSTEAIDAGKKTTVFDEAGFTQMLVNNGIEIKGKFAALPDSGKKGWEGRYRMNGRQMLEGPLLRAKGVLVLETGKSVVMDDEAYETLLALPRHKALREEIETAEAEADEAAKKAKRSSRTKK